MESLIDNFLERITKHEVRIGERWWRSSWRSAVSPNSPSPTPTKLRQRCCIIPADLAADLTSATRAFPVASPSPCAWTFLTVTTVTNEHRQVPPGLDRLYHWGADQHRQRSHRRHHLRPLHGIAEICSSSKAARRLPGLNSASTRPTGSCSRSLTVPSCSRARHDPTVITERYLRPRLPPHRLQCGASGPRPRTRSAGPVLLLARRLLRRHHASSHPKRCRNFLRRRIWTRIVSWNSP